MMAGGMLYSFKDTFRAAASMRLLVRTVLPAWKPGQITVATPRPIGELGPTPRGSRTMP